MLIIVLVEGKFSDPGIWLDELVLVDVEKDRANVVEEPINPSEMQK